MSLLGAAGAAAQGTPESKVLLFHGGTSNGSVDEGIAAITELGDENGFTVDATADAADITSANLDDYRAVIALHSSGDVLNAEQQAALQSYVQAGGGFVGIGEAANLQPGDSFFGGLIGARPADDSSDEVTEQIVEVGDRVHPATRDLPLEWGPRSDAWYEWRQNPTGQVHTVARVRFGAVADDGYRNGTTSRPISWCRDFQGGRSFYTGMGRTPESYAEANFRQHLLGAIEWAAGMVRGGCKATIASNYQTTRLTNGANGLAFNGESHGVTIAPNGWAITISRAACGSDAERGARIGQPSFPRTLDFTNPNVGVGCAPIHVWDPEEADGTLNSGSTRAGTLTVYGDRGGGSEVNGKIETGGLGITVAPDFMQTGHIYVLYFPSFNPDNPVHPGLEDGDRRRITKMGVGRVSRFTIDLETKKLDLASEVPIFEYNSQIYSCCHRGGGMGFDSEGNLYVTTGDSNSSGGGYSGNWQNVRCPTGDPNTVSNAHCGDNGISYRDARRTAGNTNDYNGKMLRINPMESIGDGERPEIGVGSTYTLPDADSPNGPNLFDGSEGGGGLAKPEIYAMGLRNPSRLTIDPETDTPYAAWVGPDAGSPSSSQGPSTYETASMIPHAGNWGWPYCMGNKQAYRDRLPDSSLRTTNEAGFVSGGSAGSPSQGWYDCDNLVNNSTNNTGLETLPHETGTGADAGKVHPSNLWYSRGNPGGQGCPDFPRPNGAPDYGATNTQLCPYYNNLGGWTVMSGPVYRYDENAEDNSVRWPEYWDGRWFVHDFSGGNQKSFGFLMGQDGDEGGQPEYVDKMSQYINWSGGSYMDSKYGPDGALYLQTYSEYFGHGVNDGLHRVAYIGGPDTPGPDPQWQAGDATGEVRFSIGKSGGVSYEWSFGDDATSDEANPTHTYDTPGIYEAELTVTYADGDTASKTVEVNVSDDETAPVTTSSLNPAQPGAGGEYPEGPVEVTLSATDGEGTPAPEPENHDVDAQPSSWDPDQVDAVTGDTVTWNFPTTAGTIHDVWVIKPGEPANSQGTQISDGYVDPGGEPVSTTVDQAGTWTFLCKVHSVQNTEGEWTGMVGTIDVAEGGGGETATGVASTEYRVNTDGGTGEWQTADNGDEADPFVTTVTVEDPGSHVVEYRSRDRAGNVEETKSVAFSIADQEPPGGGGQCLPQSDEFEGDALDGKWDVLRPAGDGPQVANGTLNLEIRQGDFIANDPLAENVLLQDAPDGEWTATAKLDTSQIEANGEQAGLVIWKSENPNTFSKVMAIHSGQGVDQFEHIVTQDGSVSPPIPQSITPAPGGEMPDTVLLRARYDGTQVIGEFSDDNGTSWTRIGQEGHAAPLTGQLRVGVVAFRGSQGGGTASFDWFRMLSGSEEGGPVECAGNCNPLSDQFDGTELDSKWELVNPSTGNAPSVDGGHLTLPVIQGDLYGGTGNAQLLLQQAPADSWVATAKVAHENIDQNGEAAGLALINSFNPNHFVKTTLQYKSDSDLSTPGDQPGKWAERVVTADNNAVVIPPATVPYPNSGALDIAGDYVWVRFVYDAQAQELTTWTSTDGSTFASFGAPIDVEAYLSQPGGLRVGVFAKHDNGTADDVVQIDAFNVVSGTTDPQTPGDDCGAGAGQCPQTDEFEGTELDSKWQVINPNPSGLTVGGGNLTLSTAQGDVSGSAFSAQNILLQDVPEGPWTATLKLDPTAIAVNGQAAGMVIYGSDNPNYFAKSAIQYKNDWQGAPINGIWAERILTTNNARNSDYGGEFPHSEKLEPAGNALWLRTTFDGENVITEYSVDGETWAQQAPPFPASVLGANGVTKLGLFVKHDGGNPTAEVDFDSFTVESDSCGGGEPSDTSPPRTTHTLDPENPDGGSGWYVSPVEVTLDATDNDGGSGVATTEYRMAGDDEWTAYEGPFSVSEDGRHTIEYRSTDEAGNTETTRSVSFMIDRADPTTRAQLNGEDPVDNYDGPVEVDLDADDGDGSGVQGTEIRVDGGEWQPYVEEEVILNSAQDLEAWMQAGPGGLNWIDQEGGFARTTGGLGMPWYPKEYGDFSLKLQWRDSSTGSNGNSGIFARFPNPVEAVQRPADERYPCQVGSATSSPAWVAIYCGHEIQINDHQGDPQKTGSIYNFSPLDATEAKIQPRGTWVDYELRVVGQTYTIIRNGEVLQEFQNSPDQQSSRAGDPPTNARQFARGYIGLQNHSNNDVIDFRNVRVLPLDEGAVQGPVTVEGDGEHTVEFRSTDAAGNEEDVKSVTFTIGEDGGPGGDENPTVDGFADPATGAAPLQVQFSASGLDPQGGRLTYEWRFGDGSGQFDDNPRHTYTEPGTYTATVIATDPDGNTGEDTVEIVVTEDGNEAPTVEAAANPIRGVAPLEVVLSARASDPDGRAADITYLWDFDDGGADAFGRTARHTFLQPGTYNVTVTATDAEGAFDTAEVTVEVTNPPGNRAPSVQAAADPRSGTAPLRVRFTSAVAEPDGDPVMIVWDFGDGLKAGGATAVHTYSQPGTYTATITVTDPDGLTGTDTVQVTVGAAPGAAPRPLLPAPFAPPVGNPAPAPAPQGDVGGESESRPLVRAPKSKKVRRVMRRGLRLKVSCLERCKARSVLRLDGHRIGKSKRLRIRADRSRTLVIRLNRRVRRNLLAAMRQADTRRLTATAVTTIRTADGKDRVRTKVRLRR